MSWATETELKYLDRIGTFAKDSGPVKSKTREEMLSGYLAGAKLREDWCKIDKKDIFEYLFNHLD